MNLKIFSFFVLLLYLTLCSITDIQTKKISLKISISFLMIGIFLFSLMQGDIKILLANLFTAFFLIIFSIITKGAIGLGDGIIFFVLSFYFTNTATLLILFFSLFFASLFSIILLLRGYSRKYYFAFAPFINLGFLFFSFLDFFERTH